MKVKNILLMFSLVILFQSCGKTIEVPKNQVAVIVESSGVKNEVLLEGIHEINRASDVIFFNTTLRQLAFSFEFTLKDASTGNVYFYMTYYPLTNEISRFYKTYRTDDIDRVIIPEIRTIIRDEFDHYQKNELQRNVEEIISKTLNHKAGVLQFIKINNISNARVTFVN